jgi:hypothetical protein
MKLPARLKTDCFAGFSGSNFRETEPAEGLFDFRISFPPIRSLPMGFTMSLMNKMVVFNF